ncbi:MULTISPECIES: DHH family phosphoesterase [Gemella]|uniref:DHH family phosphoesterase n=1 Tax=Gemella TaxID=1378 RepID=UPI000768374B|nr:MULTISPECIES: DHH family phosphoesterase [Gemella]AME10052.1 phosphoesterase [Gemella sp. oral taxon 928]AXI26188.1 DHH family phosphoesterase [Gemella sp. ND 6198]
MSEKRKYEVLILIIFILGAVFISIFSIESLIVYLIVGLLLLIPFYYHGQKQEEQTTRYINKLTNRIKDSTEKGINKFPIGIIVIDEEKNIEWANNFIYKNIKVDEIHGVNILELMPELANLFEVETPVDNQFEIFGKHYKVNYQKDSGYIYFFDITEAKVVMQRFRDTRPIILNLSLDNYEDVYDSLDDEVASRLDANIVITLTEWAKKNSIYLKRIDEDRFIGLLNVKDLKKIEKDKFQILDSIRNLKEDFDAPVTLSIGVGVGTDFLPELGELAKSSLDLALGRGGDQVAIKDVDGTIRFYGGKTNPQEKRTRIKARVVSNALADIVNDSDKIIVMGHKRPDFDAIGGCIGIYTFSKIVGKECYIVLNESDMDETIKKIMAEIHSTDENLARVFVTSDEAWELMTPQTTLLIVDTSDASRVIDVGILQKATKKVIIDHHRRGEDIITNPLLTYIEPYASSASELIAELIEYQTKIEKITPLAATIMLGGIVVDTQNFSIRTGSRTFSAAGYLRSNGADPTKVKTILKEPIENFMNRVEIINNSIQKTSEIVIALAPNDKKYTNVMLAQSADLLLSLKGIECSFAVGYLDENKVGVSARSLGNMNVQLVMEELGGGGHLANAATQIEETTIEEVLERLNKAIDEILLA